MNRRILVAVWMSLAWGLGACASSGSETGSAQAQAQPDVYAHAPADSPLSGVRLGMTDTDVRRLLGNPDRSNAYMTGKAWIPFYYGSDTHRADWMYGGKGRVVFSRNRYSGGLKVVQVLYNPSELR